MAGTRAHALAAALGLVALVACQAPPAADGKTPALATRTVDLAPPVRIGAPGGTLPLEATTELDVFDAEARRILAAGPARKFDFTVVATATRPDGGAFSRVERSNRHITLATYRVEVMPDAQPTATPAAATPAPAPCPAAFLQ